MTLALSLVDFSSLGMSTPGGGGACIGGTTLNGGANQTAGGTTDPDYPASPPSGYDANVGVGVQNNGNGGAGFRAGHGLVVISYP